MQKVNDNLYILIVLGVVGTLLLSVGIIYFFTSYIKKVALQKIELQKKETEYQARLFTAVIQSQEEEQRKIGKEIHDEAGSLLSSVKLRLSSAAMDATDQPVLKESIVAIDKLSAIIRNIAHLLSPPELELAGFHDALDSLCDGFSSDKISIKLQDDAAGFIPKNKFQLSVSLYRIIQELITNTIKHAGASVINIQVKNENNIFIIDYSDNGKGFDPANTDQQGLGTQNIQSRLMMIHATHQIETGEGKGFRFIIYLDHKFILS
ncbi:MAG: ATP-binding protein [Ferruginibacter sp.]